MNSYEDRQKLIERGYALMSKQGEAISGQSGDDKTFDLALKLVRGLTLTVEEAFPIMQQWNESNTEPWTDSRLQYKLKEAEEKSNLEFGFLLNESTSRTRPTVQQQPKPQPQAQAQAKANSSLAFPFPKTLKLDEDSVKTPAGEILTWDNYQFNGKAEGDVVENTVYRYDDGDGNPHRLFWRVKFKDGSKTFRTYQYSNGQYTTGGGRIDVPFNLHRLKQCDVVYYVEGEKCVVALQQWLDSAGTTDAVATTLGSSDNVQPDVLKEWLGGKKVYIIPDNDKQGSKCAKKVHDALLGTGSEIQIWQWKDGTGEKYDIADLLRDSADIQPVDGTSESVFETLTNTGTGTLTDGSYLWTAKEESADDDDDLPFMTMAMLYDEAPKEPPFVVDGLIHQGDGVIISGARGTGKSWLLIEVSHGVTTGKAIFGGRFKGTDNPQPVIYIDGEMAKWLALDRLECAGIEKDNPNFTLVSWKDIWKKYNKSMNLAEDIWQERLVKLVKKRKATMVIVDPLTFLYKPDADANSVEYAQPLNKLLLMLQDLNCVLVISAHEGVQPGRPRGTTGIEDAMSVCISLTLPKDGKDRTKGAEFDFNVTKNRSVFGESCRTFRAELTNGQWTTRDELDIKEEKIDEWTQQRNFAIAKFKEGFRPSTLFALAKNPEYKGLIPTQKDCTTIYNEVMPGYIKELLNSGKYTVPELIEKYDPALVARVYLETHSSCLGFSTGQLLLDGVSYDTVFKEYQKLSGSNEVPQELTDAQAKLTAERNSKAKELFFGELDTGKTTDILKEDPRFKKRYPVATWAKEWQFDRIGERLKAGKTPLEIKQETLDNGEAVFDTKVIIDVCLKRADDMQAEANALIDAGFNPKEVKDVLKAQPKPKQPLAGTAKEEADVDVTTADVPKLEA